MKRNHKYNVSRAEDRRWRGKTYDSKAEMRYAQQLDMCVQAGDILGYVEQPQVPMGGDLRYKPDFLVIEAQETYAVDVKGVETQAFKQICKLWDHPYRLHVVKSDGDGFKTTDIYPKDR